MTEPIRIAQVLNRMDSGGIEAVVMNYYRHIDRNRVQFDFYFAEDSSFPQREELQRLGAGLYPIPAYSHALRYHRALYHAFRERRYPVVHAHLSTMSLFPLFAAWRAKVPVRICHNHSTANWGEGKKTLLKYLLRPFNKIFANRWFACGEVAGRWMYGNRAFDSGKVHILLNAIDVARYAYDAEANVSLRRELDIPQDTFVVGHVGRFMYQKNHAYLIDIFENVLRKNPNAILLLIGEGELEQQIRKRVEAKHLSNQVRITGARRDVDKLYSVMDVFCIPSFYEGMPLVAWEAQANGLPCVFSNHITLEAKQSDNCALLSLDDGVEAWTQAILASVRAKGVAVPDISNEAQRLASFYLAESPTHDGLIRVAQILNRMDSGGIEAVVMNYYRHIDRSRVQFDFYFAADSSFPQRAELERLGAGIYPIPAYTQAIAYHRTLYRAFRERGYRVVHANLSTMSVFPLFAAWRARVPIRICHNHSTAHWGEGKKTLLKYLLRPLNKIFANRWFACGEMAGRWMYGNRAYENGKVHIMLNAIDMHKYAYDPEACKNARMELGIPQDAYVVGHVGRFMYQKNHAFLVEVFAQLLKEKPNAMLLLVGEGELEQQIEQMAQDMGLSNHVVFTGARNDVDKLYSVMNVFCLPSHYEGFGLVAIEAQAVGIPCICSHEVPKEVDFTNQVIHLSTGKKDVAVWVAEIVKVASGTVPSTHVFPAQFSIDFAASQYMEYIGGCYEDALSKS